MICRPIDTVADAAGCITAERVGALGVYAGDRLVGIISEYDLVRAVADGVDPHEVPVDACATWGVHTAPLDERTTTVARRMLDRAVRTHAGGPPREGGRDSAKRRRAGGASSTPTRYAWLVDAALRAAERGVPGTGSLRIFCSSSALAGGPVSCG
jgi:CBS domain-containing protein